MSANILISPRNLASVRRILLPALADEVENSAFQSSCILSGVLEDTEDRNIVSEMTPSHKAGRVAFFHVPLVSSILGGQ